jgi:UDP-glucuronate 4-epimerase
MTEGRSFLVTGAAGFIGSHTSETLLARGDRVVGIDNFNTYYPPARKRRNVEEVCESTGATFERFDVVEGDIRDRALLNQVFSRGPFDAVIHLAAMAGVRVSVEDPWLYYDVNLTGTLNLLDAACRHPAADGKPPVFVFASTSSVYGATKTIPFVETDGADRPLAPYPASKRAAELLGHSYHHLFGVDFNALRFFTVYGPRGRPDMMAYKVLDSIRLGEEVPLYNEGNMHRDWTYVSDIVAGIVAAADRRLGYQVMNLGRGEPVLLADFVAGIEKLAERPAILVPAPMMDADVAYTYADASKARELLGYQPGVGVEEGCRRFFEWYLREVGELVVEEVPLEEPL